jgi:hypothetical protein
MNVYVLEDTEGDRKIIGVFRSHYVVTKNYPDVSFTRINEEDTVRCWGGRETDRSEINWTYLLSEHWMDMLPGDLKEPTNKDTPPFLPPLEVHPNRFSKSGASSKETVIRSGPQYGKTKEINEL